MTSRRASALVVLESKFTVAPLQSSDAVGAVNEGEAVQSIVALPPAAPIVVFNVSVTAMIYALVLHCVLQISVASHVWVKTFTHELPVVVLVSKFTVAPLQSSDAVGGVNFFFYVHAILRFLPSSPTLGSSDLVAVITWLTVAE